MILVLSLASILSLHIAAVPPSSPPPVPEVWVDDDYDAQTPGWGVTHFATITDGMNAIDEFGTVHVQSGVYPESVGLKIGVTVVGEGPTQPRLVSVGLRRLSTIRNLRIRNELGTAVVALTGAEGFRIEGNTILGEREGIRFLQDDAVIENNRFPRSDRDDYIAVKCDGDRIRVNGNVFLGAYWAIYLGGNELVIDGNSIFDSARAIQVAGERPIICNNTIIKENGAWPTHEAIIANPRGGGWTIQGNRIERCDTGIEVQGDPLEPEEAGEISSNLILNSGIFSRGISVSDRAEVHDNVLWSSVRSAVGILVRTGNVTVHHNLIIGVEIGLELGPETAGVAIDQDVFRSNVVIGANHGFYNRRTLARGTSVINNAFLSGQRGFRVNVLADSTRVSGNAFADNELGVLLTAGSQTWRFDENSFHNQVNAQADGIGEFFRLNPPAGNYWSDYAGNDSNGDGVGDSPHPVGGASGASDDFPLMEPGRQAVMWADLYDGPANSPPAVTFHINAGRSHAGQAFVILPSQSGLQPETPLPNGAELPIEADDLTALVWNATGPIFASFRGTLDAQGRGVTTIQLPPLPASFEDTFLYFAAVIGPAWDRPTNAIGFYWQ